MLANKKESLDCNIELLNSGFLSSFLNPWSLVQKPDFTWKTSNVVGIFTWSLENKFSLALNTDWLLGAFFFWMTNI